MRPQSLDRRAAVLQYALRDQDMDLECGVHACHATQTKCNTVLPFRGYARAVVAMRVKLTNTKMLIFA